MGMDASDRRARGLLRLDWTDARIAVITRRWAEGASAGTIAKELGRGVSRSAVLGKIHRLDLPRPEVKHRRTPEPGTRRSRRRPRSADKVGRSLCASKSELRLAFEALGLDEFRGRLDESTAHPDAGKAFGTPRTLLELSDETCRWPVGDPGSPEFMFCGAAPFKAHPYCLAHCLIGYRPESAERAPRTRRRPLRNIFYRAADHAA